MLKPFDKHKFATQPEYYTKIPKIKAREQVVAAYREITGQHSIPHDRGYWTFCNKQPDAEVCYHCDSAYAGTWMVGKFNCWLYAK